jgi:hypothetical protein
MKHYPLLSFLLFTSAAAISLRTTGQSSTLTQPALYSANSVRTAPLAFLHEENSFKSNVRLNEINIHAMRHFLKNFPASADEYWLKTNSGYIVKFKNADILNEVYYKLNGSFQYSVRYYAESNLQKDLRNQVHQQFIGYTIAVVIEISDSDQKLYRIKITDRESIKTLQFFDGKLEIIDDLKNLGI